MTRVRTVPEGPRGFTLGGGRLSLRPSVEVDLRRDGGDAETLVARPSIGGPSTWKWGQARASGMSQKCLYTCIVWPAGCRNARFPGRLWAVAS